MHVSIEYVEEKCKEPVWALSMHVLQWGYDGQIDTQTWWHWYSKNSGSCMEQIKEILLNIAKEIKTVN